MTKKQIAAVVTGILSLIAAVTVAIGSGNAKGDSILERVTVVETDYKGLDSRLKRVEDKQDRTIELLIEMKKGR